MVTKISSSTTKGVTLREDVTKLKTLIDTKTAELLELTKTLGSKQEFAEKNPTVTTTTGQISELKVEIETIEKLIKTTRKEYVAAYAESASLQRLIDHFTTQKREYEEEVRQNEELIEKMERLMAEEKLEQRENENSENKNNNYVSTNNQHTPLHTVTIRSIQNINPTLQSEIAGDYQGTHVLAYDVDEDLKGLGFWASSFE